MTDRELLELAAKAAGYTLGQHSQKDGAVTLGCKEWNPLIDDGDALRLSVRLLIDIEHSHPSDQRGYVIASRRECGTVFDRVFIVEETDGNTYAATRRAIVRAAAEIGRNKN